MGKTNRPSYRIVVAEHSRPVKGKSIEVLGYYNPIANPKLLEFDEERIKHWISVGAKPTDTVASLLKSKGVSDMDQYIDPRDKKKKKKNGEEPAPIQPVVAKPVVAPVAEVAPIEEVAPVAEEAPVEKVEEATPEVPAEEVTPVEEVPTTEETPPEESKTE